MTSSDQMMGLFQKNEEAQPVRGEWYEGNGIMGNNRAQKGWEKDQQFHKLNSFQETLLLNKNGYFWPLNQTGKYSR